MGKPYKDSVLRILKTKKCFCFLKYIFVIFIFYLYLSYIYHCLPSDRIWHKVFFIAGILGKREVGYQSWLVPCWTMFVIGSLGAMWVSKFKFSRVQPLCLLIAWTRPKGLVLYCDCQWFFAHPKVAQPEPGGHSTLNLSLTLIAYPVWMPDGQVKKPGTCAR